MDDAAIDQLAGLVVKKVIKMLESEDKEKLRQLLRGKV
jgi:hypothetical protein